MQTYLRPHDGLRSLAYVLLYLLMGDLPWRISFAQASGDATDPQLALWWLNFCCGPSGRKETSSLLPSLDGKPAHVHEKNA
jgi:hypothetical protein